MAGETAGGIYLPQKSSVVAETVTLKAFNATTIQVKYRDTSGTGSSSTTVTADKLKFDLTQGFDEQILSSSVRFKLGSDTFIDRTGLLYRNVDSVTGSGTQSGIIQYGTGVVEFDSWTPNVDNQLTLQSLTTTTDMLPTTSALVRRQFRFALVHLQLWWVKLRAVS